MNPFLVQSGRRMLLEEISALYEQRNNSTLINGFSELLDIGNAIENTERVSGYLEALDRREWLISLKAEKPLRWKTDVVKNLNTATVTFALNMGLGNGSPLPQPTSAWKISVNGRHALSIRGVNHSQLWRHNECSMAFAANRIETALPFQSMCLSSIITNESMAAFGPGLLKVPTAWLETGKAAEICIEPETKVDSTRWFQLAPGGNMIMESDIWAAVDVLNDQRYCDKDSNKVYFGDIHTHSGQVRDTEQSGCGCGSRADNYEYAMGPGGLDFYSLTEHEWQVDQNSPVDFYKLADEYTKDGRFVCLPAYEYSNRLYGHRNVYFRDSIANVLFSNNRLPDKGSTLNPDECSNPNELWEALEKCDVPFITVPHHSSATSHPFNSEFYNPKYDRLFEIYSGWGSSEYYGDFPRGVSDRLKCCSYQDIIKQGQRYGIIASSDGHDGHPGHNQSPLFKHHHIFHFCGSGYAAVFVPELTRHAVFDALHARRCYGTTGVPIILDIDVCGYPMGSEISALKQHQKPQIKITCRGTNGLDHIRIMKNGQIIHCIPCCGQHYVELEWEDCEYSTDQSASYYVRAVQVDRESAWSSPVWIG